MESKIRTIPKSKLRKIKEMSPFMIDELMLVGLRLLNDKEGEENVDKQKTINDIINNH